MEVLKRIYYDPISGFKAADKLYHEAKKVDASITHKLVKEFLSKQEEYQLNKKPQKQKFFKIIASRGVYQADLAFLPYESSNYGYNGFITLIEIATRQVRIHPIKTKGAQTIANGFEQLLNQVDYPVEEVMTDSGLEWLNKSFGDLMRKNNITHVAIPPNEHSKLSIVERFHRTIKQMLNRYFTMYKTTRWYEAIGELVENYNNTKHDTLGVEPNEVTEALVAQEIKNGINHNSMLKKKDSLSVGDYVRIPKATGIFEKAGNKFSRDVYTVDSIRGYRYFLRNESGEMLTEGYLARELQKIDKSQIVPISGNDAAKLSRIDANKKAKTVKRRLNKEGIDPANVMSTRVTRSSARPRAS